MKQLKTADIEKRFSLLDRAVCVRTMVNAINFVIEHRDGVGAALLVDGIKNALDGRSTGREFRTMRHAARSLHDPQHFPVIAEQDRRCQNCGAPGPFGVKPCTECHPC